MATTIFSTNTEPYGISCNLCGACAANLNALKHYYGCVFTTGSAEVFNELSICSQYSISDDVEDPILRELDNIWSISDKSGVVIEYVAGGLNELEAINALDRKIFPDIAGLSATYLNKDLGSVKINGSEIPAEIRQDLTSLLNSNTRTLEFKVISGVLVSYQPNPSESRLTFPNSLLATLFGISLFGLSKYELPLNKKANLFIHDKWVEVQLQVSYGDKQGTYDLSLIAEDEVKTL